MEDIKLTKKNNLYRFGKNFPKFVTGDEEKALEVKENLKFTSLLEWYFNGRGYTTVNIGVNNEGVPVVKNGKPLELRYYKDDIIEFCDTIIEWNETTKFPRGMYDVRSYVDHLSDNAKELKRII